MPIPQIAHRIWFGEPFPEKYSNDLFQLKILNPQYKVILWTDSKTMSENYYAELKQRCNNHEIILQDIREQTHLANYGIIIEELEAGIAQAETQKKPLYYVRAADIARFAILFEMGGVYSDTDSQVEKAFPQFKTPHGLLIKLFGNQEFSVIFNLFFVDHHQHQCFFSDVLYDFLVSEPQSSILATTNHIIALDYEVYHKSKHKQWQNSLDRQTLLYGTIKLSGTALKRALNYLHQSGKLNFSKTEDILFDTAGFIDSSYDKSWLSGFCDNNESDDLSLEHFCAEIEANRDQNYPIKNFGPHPLSQDEMSYARIWCMEK